MIRWFKQLDGVLRGGAKQQEALGDGPGHVSARGLSVTVLVLCAVYGAAMGSFTAIRTGGTELNQILASAVKLPLLFFLTLLVTLPSLYVFSALVGARLRARAVCRLLVAMVGVIAAVLASFAPILVFFSVSTTSYPFMKVLNVVMCGIAGLLGLAFLIKTLRTLIAAHDDSTSQDNPADQTSPQDEIDIDIEPTPSGNHRAAVVFRIWVILFSFVGVQMSWVLRPFIGHPDLPFAWFRNRESNFFTDILSAIQTLLGG